METAGEEKDPSCIVRELHTGLARKYSAHGPKFESIWRSYDRTQRLQKMVDRALDGMVPRHVSDDSLRHNYHFVPDWNVQDIVDGGPQPLLDILKFRTTRTLLEQFHKGVDGGAGDYAVILEAMQKKNLRHPRPHRNALVAFTEDTNIYATYHCFEGILPKSGKGMQIHFLSHILVPYDTGDLVVARQIKWLEFLHFMVEDVVIGDPTVRVERQRPKRFDATRLAALSRLQVSTHTPTKRCSLAELAMSAIDQKELLEGNLDLLSTQSVVLARAIKFRFFSMPGFVPNPKKIAEYDKHMSIAFFEVIHSAVQAISIWDYTSRLIGLLENSTGDKIYRLAILQELSNVCRLDYERVHAIFRRYVQAGSGCQWVQLTLKDCDDGTNVRAVITGDPKTLTRIDPQLHYILRLFQAQKNPVEAIEWLQKLSALHESHPSERQKLMEVETNAICDLAVNIDFTQDLSSIYRLPSYSRKDGHMFASKLRDLEREVNHLKTKVNLHRFIAPLGNLIEPGASKKALETIDQFVVETLGTKMGFLYEDLVEECFLELQSRCERRKDDLKQNDQAEPPKFEAPVQHSPEKLLEWRKEKHKTRPVQPTCYQIVPDASQPAEDEPSRPRQVIKVHSSTVEVFSNLFSKSQARGPVNWEAFKAAMADVGFSISPRHGSVYTFFPSDDLDIKRPITIHRSHTSQIDGYKVLILARRLNRAFGWDGDTFEAA